MVPRRGTPRTLERLSVYKVIYGQQIAQLTAQELRDLLDESMLPYSWQPGVITIYGTQGLVHIDARRIQ